VRGPREHDSERRRFGRPRAPQNITREREAHGVQRRAGHEGLNERTAVLSSRDACGLGCAAVGGHSPDPSKDSIFAPPPELGDEDFSSSLPERWLCSEHAEGLRVGEYARDLLSPRLIRGGQWCASWALATLRCSAGSAHQSSQAARVTGKDHHAKGFLLGHPRMPGRGVNATTTDQACGRPASS